MTRTPSLLALVATLGAAACGTNDFLVVTVESRPAVHSPTTLAVKISNGSSEVAQMFEVSAASFPASFSVGPDQRDTPLTITVEARDGQGLLAGRGTTTAGADADTTRVTLESADFVVNTDYAGDQVPSNDFEAHGFQVAAAGDGTTTVVYRENACATAGCDIYARRFDASGRPLSSQIAAGTNSFKISSRLTSSLSTPATAANATSSVVVWDYDEPGAGALQGITCRSLDGNGGANPNEVLVATETSPDVVSVTAMSNSNFAITWSALPATQREIRGVVVRPDCTTLGVVTTISQDPATAATRSSVAANASGLMFAWIVDGSVFVRGYTNGLAATTATVNIVGKTSTERVDHARIVSYAGGYAIIVRWGLITGATGPGRLEMYRVNNQGALQGLPTLVSDRSGSDFDSRQGFGVASRPDGTMMTVWHSCNENGDGEGCGVFGRVFGPGGQPVGDDLVISTTTQGNQSKPSVAGAGNAFVAVWADESGTDPDRAGASVRARVLYPAVTPSE